MSIVVVGSVAFDSIETPFGRAERALGGSATYFAVAASFFAPVQLVGVVGEDFTQKDMEVFAGRDIDTSGLVRAAGKTFHWKGQYGFDLNMPKTLATELNVFADFRPNLPEKFQSAPVAFLANIDPTLQLDVLEQLRNPRLTALDTMNYWISSQKGDLEKVIARVNLVVINEAEVRQFTGEVNLIRGARSILRLGPQAIVIKRGEYGVLMITRDRVFVAPAYPLEAVFDPTGAGDSFAGGLIGYLATRPQFEETDLRRAVVYGSVLASFNVEAFSLDRLRKLSRDDIERRYQEFRALTHFEEIEPVRSKTT